jgi:serine/threonine protein phosphatase 1
VKFVPAPGVLPVGLRVYAIGDVHGCADKLASVHAQIKEDCLSRPAPSVVVVHLGDYIDRGPDSAGVVEMLASGPPVDGAEAVNLMGNHERCMLDALAGQQAARTDWLFNGGSDALRSWGIDPRAPTEEWREAIPARHLALLEGLAVSHRIGGYLFAHAGVRPGISLDAQAPADLISIRQIFLTSEADFGAVVVHGHTPTRGPVVKANRIGIDTGAVYGRELTCVVLEEDRLAFLDA